MKKKVKHNKIEQVDQQEDSNQQTGNQNNIDKHNNPTKLTKQKKIKQVYARVNVDPSKQYRTPESRESWGPNVKGKKFRKEKGKKKRCPNAGVRIDGAVNSIRLDA